MHTRREMLAAALAASFAAPGVWAEGGAGTLKQIHKRIGGRLGVHVLDSQSGRRISYDDTSRFAMASTFKLPLAAALLWQIDHGPVTLTSTLPIARGDLLANSPVIEQRLKEGATNLSIRELCAAAMEQSDNAAANILLKGIGGPAALATFTHSIGDEVTRFDRIEPDLNSNLPNDPRDTTTPRAMADLMLAIFTQNVLSLSGRALLIDWMSNARTGMDRIRAGIPKSWQAGDKTGTGENGAVNDLAIVWPSERRPIFIAAFMSESKLSTAELSAAHAQIGALIGREKWK